MNLEPCPACGRQPEFHIGSNRHSCCHGDPYSGAFLSSAYGNTYRDSERVSPAENWNAMVASLNAMRRERDELRAAIWKALPDIEAITRMANEEWGKPGDDYSNALDVLRAVMAEKKS
jgi:hypothetical protein